MRQKKEKNVEMDQIQNGYFFKKKQKKNTEQSDPYSRRNPNREELV